MQIPNFGVPSPKSNRLFAFPISQKPRDNILKNAAHRQNDRQKTTNSKWQTGHFNV